MIERIRFPEFPEAIDMDRLDEVFVEDEGEKALDAEVASRVIRYAHWARKVNRRWHESEEARSA